MDVRYRQSRSVFGFTLIEALMTMFVIGLIAAIVLPATNDNRINRVDAAAAEVAAAIRFARDESIRTGTPHGVRHQGGANRFRVFRLDGTGTPVYDVYHPIVKQLWDLEFDASPHYAGISISRSVDWRGTCNVGGNIAFRSDGTPFCTDPITTLLDTGELTLEIAEDDRDVMVDGFTGRVWLK